MSEPKDSQLQAVLLLVTLDRTLAAELLSGLAAPAAAEVVRLSKTLDALPMARRQALMTAVLSHFARQDAESLLQQLDSRLMPAAPVANSTVAGDPAFEALAKQSDAMLEKLVAGLDDRLLALALRGATAAAREAFIRNLTIRRAAELQRRIGTMALAKPADMQRAQQVIVDLTHRTRS